MHYFALLIAYDGTNFAGWQVQNNALSIQHLIEEALSTILREDVTLIGSGRTDAGVHAEGQVAHFKTTVSLARAKSLRSLNALLPSDVRVLKMAEVSPSFHAQRSAKGKIYRYRLDLATFSDPFERRVRQNVGHLPHLDEMEKAAMHFVGTHNFLAFANDNSKGAAAKNPVRTIHKIAFYQCGDFLDIDWHGEGFLYKMVRNLMGCLLAVGRGKMQAGDIPRLLSSLDRRLAPPAAAAKGLTLLRVLYDPDPFSANGPSLGIEQKESKITVSLGSMEK